jgi:hypothetical protein
MKEEIKYVRGVDIETGKPRLLGVVVCTGPGQVGWAKVHENDVNRFDRKKGLMIARGRAAVTDERRRNRMMQNIPWGLTEDVLSLLYKSEIGGWGT